MVFLFPLFLIGLGLILLTLGGEFLVRGSSSLAAALRISPLVIGLTVVAFGTSSPEMAVTVSAAFQGEADLAVGNVVGSNICNVLFILGLSALVAPLVVSSQLIRLDVPVMIVVSVVTYLLVLDERLSTLDGALLFSALMAYVVWSIQTSRREQRAVQKEFEAEYGETAPPAPARLLANVLLVMGGLVLLGIGADWLVRGSVSIARILGVSELIIGLTIVALGTSLPEAAASIVAAFRGERDIAVGNVVGSNIFNLLCVLGLAGIVSPRDIEIPETALRFDMPIMIAIAVACLPVFFTGRTITRWNGGIFFAYYLAYLTALVLRATQSPLTGEFGALMFFFVVPLTVFALVVGVVRSLRLPHDQTV